MAQWLKTMPGPKPIGRRQLRILAALAADDLIWEVAGESYYTQFDERAGKSIKIRPSEIEEFADLGWIQHVIPPASAHRLAFCEITDLGRATFQQRIPVNRL